MKRTITVLAGLALASGYAVAQQEGTTQEYDPERDITTQTERDRGMGMEQPRTDTPTQSEYGTEAERDYETQTDPYGTESQTGQSQTESQTGQSQTGQEDWSTQSGMTHGSVADMTAEELKGKTIVTTDGEEIGEIGEVGYSSTHQERVATVEVGGFLGVGQKRIAVPLSKLQSSATDENSVETSMTREEIESEEEFEETGFGVGQEQ